MQNLIKEWLFKNGASHLYESIPSLLSAMEAEIRREIGFNELTEYTVSKDGDTKSETDIKAVVRNEERQRCHTIIHEVLNPQK